MQMVEKKNNMATRFCDEIINSMDMCAKTFREKAKTIANEAKELNLQAETIEQQIAIIMNTLQKGNYENTNGKEEKQ